MNKKIVSKSINVVQSVVYDEDFNKFTCFHLSKTDTFTIGTSIYEKARLRRFTALVKENVDNPVSNSVANRIRTNKSDRMGRVSLYRKNELLGGHRVFEICGGRGMETSVKSRTNRGLSKSKSRVSKMGILEF